MKGIINPQRFIEVEHTPVEFVIFTDNIFWGMHEHTAYGTYLLDYRAQISSHFKDIKDDPVKMKQHLWQQGWWDKFAFVGNRALGAYKLAHECRESGFTVQVVDFVTQWDIATLRLIVDKFVGDNTLAVGISNTFLVKIPNRMNVKPSSWNLDPFYGDEIKNKHYIDENSFKEGFYTGFLPHGEEIDDLFVDYVKQKNSNVKFIKGGAFTNRGSKYRNVDIVNIGYGEETVPEILNELKGGDPLDLPVNFEGMPYKEDVLSRQDVKHSTMKWHDDDLVYPGEVLSIEVSRGCIFKCKFCSFALNGKEKGEAIRDIDLIREELIHNYEKFGTECYWIVDDTFNDDHQKMVDFMEMSKSLPFKLKFACYIRLDLLYANRNRTPSQAEIIRDAGIVHVQFGVETTNPDSAVDIGKGMNPMLQFEYMRELKADVWKDVDMASGMIAGLPSDTKESLKEMANFLVSDQNPMIGTNMRALGIRPEGYDARTDSEFQKNWKDYGYEPTDHYMNGKPIPQQVKDIFSNEFIYKNRNGVGLLDAMKYSGNLNNRLIKFGKLTHNLFNKSFGMPYKMNGIKREDFDEYDPDTTKKINEIELQRINWYISKLLTK